MKTASDIREMLRDARTCMFSTLADDDTIRTRPMGVVQVDDLNQLWFFTDDHTQKVRQLDNTWQVALGFANDADSEWIAVNGHADLVHDKNRILDLWKPIYKAWFPQGLDTPGLALIRVTMERAEYWVSEGGKLVTMFEMAKAAVTGEPAKNGEHAVLEL